MNTSKDFKKKANFDDNVKSEFNVKELLSFIIHSKTDSLNKYSNYESYGLMSSSKGSVMLENKNAILFEKYKFMLHEFLISTNSSEELTNTIIGEYTKECICAYFNTMFASEHFYLKLCELLNIKLNLLNKYRKGHPLLNTLEYSKSKLLNLKSGETIQIENDSEFYFILGQLSYYIESQSKGEIDFGIFKFYTEKRYAEHIKNYLIQRLEIFGYKISLHNKVFKDILDLVLSYTPSTDILKHSEAFYIGICCENIFYKKNDNQ